MSEHTSPLWKQLLGAAAGMAIALSIYGVYTLTAPPLTAFVASVFASDQQQGLTFTDADRADRRREIASMAKEIIDQKLKRGME